MQFIRKNPAPAVGIPPPDSWCKNPDWAGLPVAGGGESFHGSKKHSSLPPPAAAASKAATAHCIIVSYCQMMAMDAFKVDQIPSWLCVRRERACAVVHSVS